MDVMLDKKIVDTYTKILREELILAMGCTEPIAIAFAAFVGVAPVVSEQRIISAGLVVV